MVSFPLTVAIKGGQGLGSDSATSYQRYGAGWLWFFRWGPYGLLGLSVLAAASTASALMTPIESALAVALVAVALSWQWMWDRPLRSMPEHSTGHIVYFAVRTVVAGALCWLNPFFAIFALMGYIDAIQHLPDRSRKWGLLAIAVALAGSQASVPDGPPPDDPSELMLFVVLLTLHCSLAIGLDRLNNRDADERRRQRELIDELAVANARLEQSLQENATLQERLVTQARSAGVAAERRRLVSDLHDVLVQGLTGVVSQLEAGLANNGEAARTHVERAAGLARHGLREARRSVHDLTPGPLERSSLPQALEGIVSRWSAVSEVRAEFTVVGIVEPLHTEIEVALLRITEEALANVTKHAGATRVGVTLSYFGDEVTLDVRDDGGGFDPSIEPVRSGHGGFGLDGMRVRAERVFGSFEVESEPGYGTAIFVQVPVVGDDS
jgi:signal transduction histidine kinase